MKRERKLWGDSAMRIFAWVEDGLKFHKLVELIIIEHFSQSKPTLVSC